MKKTIIKLFTILVFLASLPVMASGLPPWKFGMSKTDVTNQVDFGPYKSFENGDVETFNGIFNGHKENIQFFFEKGSLKRIGAYLYEGNDVKQATTAWKKAYSYLKTSYGEIEVPGITSNKQPSLDVLAIAVGANTDATGKTQMAPVKQPSDMFVFSNFIRHDIEGKPYYYVMVYLDEHP